MAGEVYRADMDTVGRFLEERCELSPAFNVRSSEIYLAYKQWAALAGEHSMSQISFSKRMKNRVGITSEHKESGTLLVGVHLRAESENQSADE